MLTKDCRSKLENKTRVAVTKDAFKRRKNIICSSINTAITMFVPFSVFRTIIIAIPLQGFAPLGIYNRLDYFSLSQNVFISEFLLSLLTW